MIWKFTEHSSDENNFSIANRAIKRNMLCLWLQNTHFIHQASRYYTNQSKVCS